MALFKTEKKNSSIFTVATTHVITTLSMLFVLGWIPAAGIGFGGEKISNVALSVYWQALFIILLIPSTIYSSKYISKKYLLSDISSVINKSVRYYSAFAILITIIGAANQALSFVVVFIPSIYLFYALSKKYVKSS